MPPWLARLPTRWLEWAAVAIVVASMVRIASTYGSLSATSDEPAHVRSALEWLEYGTYRFSAVDPPLARLPSGVGPYLAGYRFAPPDRTPPHGKSVDELDSDDPRPLALARAGVLPFFAATALVVWMWARRLSGRAGALAAVAIFAADPNVLAHAGLATTDMPFTAAFCAALLAFVTWWEDGSWRTALATAALAGTALAMKYSAFALVPCSLACAALLVWGRVRPHASARSVAQQVAAGALVAGVIVWASYRFEAGRPIAQIAPHALARLEESCSGTACEALDRVARWWMPAPAWMHGLWEFEWEQRVGHPSFLLGHWSMHGFPWFYAVALLTKTPLATLLLAALGAYALWRHEPRADAVRGLVPLAAALCLLAVVSGSHVNIGVRHALAVFPLIAIVAARGLLWLATQLAPSRAARTAGRCLGLALVGWLVVGPAAAHPAYLAYFNEAVGEDGDRVLLDSDLDWGQDLWALERVLRDLRVDRVHVAYFGPAVLSRHALPAVLPLERDRRVAGWIAVSAMYLRSPGFEWLSAYEPVARAGRSIDVYFVPPS
jgi:4-amino-4-deoxy-L-arabinose transferase-like glycosyltransferase